MRNGKCPKCGSTEIIPDVRVLDRGESNLTSDLQVAVDANPGAWVFKGRQISKLSAFVCASCGYTEMYAIDPGALMAAHQEKTS